MEKIISNEIGTEDSKFQYYDDASMKEAVENCGKLYCTNKLIYKKDITGWTEIENPYYIDLDVIKNGTYLKERESSRKWGKGFYADIINKKSDELILSINLGMNYPRGFKIESSPTFSEDGNVMHHNSGIDHGHKDEFNWKRIGYSGLCTILKSIGNETILGTN